VVKNFYELLHGKKWVETYEYRSMSFKAVISKESHLETVKSENPSWELLDYEILHAEFFGTNCAQVIIRFVEAPGPTVSYAAVMWHIEGGTWRCDEAGPRLLSVFLSLGGKRGCN
jgi:hypothetical protein